MMTDISKGRYNDRGPEDELKLLRELVKSERQTHALALADLERQAENLRRRLDAMEQVATELQEEVAGGGGATGGGATTDESTHWPAFARAKRALLEGE